MYLWRAVDSEGEVLDILVQSRRNKKAALKLMGFGAWSRDGVIAHSPVG